MNLPCNNWALQERNDFFTSSVWWALFTAQYAEEFANLDASHTIWLSSDSPAKESREVLLRLVEERFMSLLLFHLHLISKYRLLAWLHASVLHQNNNVMCWVYWCKRTSEPFPGATAALGGFSSYSFRPAWSTLAGNDVCAQRMGSGLIIMKSGINNWQTRQLVFWADSIHFPEELLHKRHHFFFLRSTYSRHYCF